MSCEEVREQLMALDAAAFAEVEHLATCAGCRAFAAQLRAMDAAVVDHVETYARSGDFAQEWDRAVRAADRRRGWRPPRGAALTVLALAAAALLVVRGMDPGDPASPMPAPPVATQPAVPPPPPVPRSSPTPAVQMPVEPSPPPPAPRPSPKPAPQPSPPVVTPSVQEPSPAVAPEPPPVVAAPPAPPVVTSPSQPPSVSPPPAAPARVPTRPRPVAAAPATAPIVVTIAPDVPGFASAELSCGSSRERRERGAAGMVFDAPAEKRCRISFPGESLQETVAPGGRYRVVLVDGRPALRPE